MDQVGKRILRREFLRRRKLLTTDEVDARSEQIWGRVLQFLDDRQHLSIFHCFLPIEHNREVNTWSLVRSLKKAGKEVLISATDFEQEAMRHFHYDEDLSFALDKFSIPTPQGGAPADLSACQCVFLPLVVADIQGGRIGYGGGYYDKLLAQMGSVLKVGLSLGPCLDKLPVLEPHDIQLDYCITPTETIDCKHD